MVDSLIKDKQLVIQVTDKLNFRIHKEFRHAYEHKDNNIEKIILDFEYLNDIDSSALGMLLQIKEYHSLKKHLIQIDNCNPDLKSILFFCNFNEIFTFHNKN